MLLNVIGSRIPNATIRRCGRHGNIACPLSGRLKHPRRSVPTCTRLPWSAEYGAYPGEDVPTRSTSFDWRPFPSRVRIARRASLRMSSDEALRIALVCMLPLLWIHGEAVTVSSSPTSIRRETFTPRHRGVRVNRVYRFHRIGSENRCPDSAFTRLHDESNNERTGRP